MSKLVGSSTEASHQSRCRKAVQRTAEEIAVVQQVFVLMMPGPITSCFVSPFAMVPEDSLYFLHLLAAERAATNSRLASTLRDCITQGANKYTKGQPPASHQSRGEQGTALQSPDAAQQPVIVVACVESAEDVAPGLRRCFTHELQLEAPDAPARKHLLQVCFASACTLI